MKESVEKHLACCCPQAIGLAANIEEMQINLFYKPKIFKLPIVEIQGAFSADGSSTIHINPRVN